MSFGSGSGKTSPQVALKRRAISRVMADRLQRHSHVHLPQHRRGSCTALVALDPAVSLERLGLQIVALGMLTVPDPWLSVPYVMAAQALSGIAKDLNKMSAKASVKLMLPQNDEQQDSRLFKWVAVLTGSKNALKGAGFFLGAALLEGVGFRGALAVLAGDADVVSDIYRKRIINRGASVLNWGVNYDKASLRAPQGIKGKASSEG